MYCNCRRGKIHVVKTLPQVRLQGLFEIKSQHIGRGPAKYLTPERKTMKDIN
jgi:hypothetical protein